MELVIGGRASGKLEYTLQISGLTRKAVAFGVLEETKPILYSLEKVIRVWMNEEFGVLSETEMIEKYLGNVLSYQKKHLQCYLICDEVGLGVVPLDAFERSYREVVGRILCELARLSHKVHRVYCGIGEIIKDDTNGTP